MLSAYGALQYHNQANNALHEATNIVEGMARLDELVALVEEDEQSGTQSTLNLSSAEAYAVARYLESVISRRLAWGLTVLAFGVGLVALRDWRKFQRLR